MSYIPSLFTVSNKPYGSAQAIPTDARSYFFHVGLITYRPFQSVTEANLYLDRDKFRVGHYSVFINPTGTLNTDQTFTGGEVIEYWYKDGIADEDLVPKLSSSGAIQNWQETLIVGSDMTQNNSVEGDDNDFNFANFNIFTIEAENLHLNGSSTYLDQYPNSDPYTAITTDSDGLIGYIDIGMTGFAVNNLSPLFVAAMDNTDPHIPILGFTLSNAAAHTIFGNHTGSSGVPSYGKVDLANEVSGNLPVTNLNSGTLASASTFWNGAGVWASAAQTWQQSLTTGSTLTQANTITGGGFAFRWNSSKHYWDMAPNGDATLNGKVNILIDDGTPSTVNTGFKVVLGRDTDSIFRIFDNLTAGSGINDAINLTLTNVSGTTVMNINGRNATFSFGATNTAVVQDGGIYFGGSSVADGSYQTKRTLIFAGADYTWQNETVTQTSGTVRMTLTAAGALSLGTVSAPATSALLDLVSTTKVVVLPRMTKAQRDAITTIAGACIYQTDNTPGFRMYNGTNWMKFTETTD